MSEIPHSQVCPQRAEVLRASHGHEWGERQSQLCFTKMPTASLTAPRHVRVDAGSISQWKHGIENKGMKEGTLNIPLLPEVAAPGCAGSAEHPQPPLCAAGPLS